MKKLITVHGMTCEGCRKAIIIGLEEVEGIENVVVNLPNRLCEVTFDEKIITLDGIKKHVQKLGYDPM